MKTESIGDRIFATREQARREIFGYIKVFYNRQRLHSYLGYVTPVTRLGIPGIVLPWLM